MIVANSLSMWAGLMVDSHHIVIYGLVHLLRATSLLIPFPVAFLQLFIPLSSGTASLSSPWLFSSMAILFSATREQKDRTMVLLYNWYSVVSPVSMAVEFQ